MTTPAGGLGRGLSTILTGPSTAPAPYGSTTDHLVDRALTEMAARGPLRVCGHLADPTGDADLTLRSPDLGSLHPTEAYQLFAALHGVDVASPGRHDLDIGSHRAMAVVVEVAGGTSMWFFGDDRLDDSELERLARIAEAYGPAVCDHRPAGVDPDPIAVEVTEAADGWAVVVRQDCGAEPSEASASAARAIDAATRATIDAFGITPTQIDVDLIAAADTGAVVVRLGVGSMLAVGAAEVEGAAHEPALAVAAVVATRRAARRVLDR